MLVCFRTMPSKKRTKNRSRPTLTHRLKKNEVLFQAFPRFYSSLDITSLMPKLAHSLFYMIVFVYAFVDKKCRQGIKKLMYRGSSHTPCTSLQKPLCQVYEAAWRDSRIQLNRIATNDKEQAAKKKRALAREEQDRRKAQHDKLRAEYRAEETLFRQ